MSNTTTRIKIGLSFTACAVTVWLAFGERAGAQTQSELSQAEKRGKLIYLKGDGGERGEIKAILGSGDLELPATAFPCANCHGLKGEGSKEGGLQPPPINWASLTSPARSALTGRERAPYNEVGVARAISSSLDSAGARLHPGMPLYAMTPEQTAGLIAYLKRIGNEADWDPGLSEDAVQVGAALPMSGPLAQVGEDVKAALTAYFSEVNSQGGIYGRKLELVVEDSRGDAAGTVEATRRLVEQDRVFALVGSFEPGGGNAAGEFLKRSETPLIGPVTISPHRSVPPNPYVFYLMPSFGDQARVLVDFVSAKAGQPKAGPAARLAVVYATGDLDRDALQGLRSQAKMHAMEIVAERGYARGGFKARSVVDDLIAKKPDYIFFFGGSNDLLAFAREMEAAKLSAALLSSFVMVGRGAFSLSSDVAARTYLSYPAALPREDELSGFMALMKKAKVTLRHSAFQRTAYAAALIFVEAMKLSGRQTSRVGLISSLEQFREFRTGVLPPVTFGPNIRIGAAGSYVVGIDLNKTQVVPLSEWLVPKERP